MDQPKRVTVADVIADHQMRDLQAGVAEIFGPPSPPKEKSPPGPDLSQLLAQYHPGQSDYDRYRQRGGPSTGGFLSGILGGAGRGLF